MYIGQDVKTTMDTPDLAPSTSPTQLAHKIRLSRELPNIQGNCWWPGYSVTANYKGVADSLATVEQRNVALVPNYPWIDSVKPSEVTSLRLDGNRLTWEAPVTDDPLQQARAYVVYRFENGKGIDISDSEAILGVTYKAEYPIGDNHGNCTYVVTVLDRANNESEKGTSITVKQ